MNARELVEAMRRRMPWDVARHYLKEHDIPVGHGWEPTIDKLGDGKSIDKETVESLWERCAEHIRVGEKAVQLYKLSKAKKQELRDALVIIAAADKRKELERSFVEEPTVGAIRAKPTLLAAVEHSEGIDAVMSSVRYTETRTDLRDDLIERGNDEFKGYSEVIGVRLERHRAFEILFVPGGKGLVQLRADAPLGATKEYVEAALSFCRDEVEAKTGVALGDPVNVFPAIKSLYDSPKEGSVVEMGFTVTSGSVKHEKMRRKHTCLRTERYHVGGKEAVGGSIQAYRLAVEWPRPPERRTVELLVPGTSLTIHDAEPSIKTFFVRKCVSSEDFDFVTGKVSKHAAAE